MDSHDELVPRTNLIDLLNISDSGERRKRKAGVDWPPHVLIGRKVYYRRESLSAWLRQRESIAPDHRNLGDHLGGVVAALRAAKVLPDPAQPLTSNQAILLSRLMGADERVSLK
jgi:hypothetical protein